MNPSTPSGNPKQPEDVESMAVIAPVDASVAGAGIDPDALYVERAIQGDGDAFRVLFERYYDKVFAIAMGVLMEHEEAADATQEVFTLVHRNLPRFDRRARFGTWLFRIAVNRSIQASRSRRKSQRNLPLEAGESRAEYPSWEGRIPDPKVARAMARLSEGDRALLTLFYWEELSLPEIGEALGCGPNAAKTRLFRARERFRAAYEEDERS